MKIKKIKIDIKNIYNNFCRIYCIFHNIDKYYVFLIILLAIVLGVIPSLSTILIQKLLNIIQNSEININQVINLVVVYIIIDIFIIVVSKFKSYYISIFQIKLNLEISNEVLKKASKLNIKDYEETESYNKIQRAQNQTGSQLLDYFNNFTIILQSIVTFFTTSFILYSWKKWSVILIFVISILNSYFKIKLSEEQYEIIRKRTTKERKKWYYQYLLTNDIAFKEINIYNLSNYFLEKYKTIYKEFMNQDKKILKKILSIETIISLLEEVVVAFLFILIIKNTIEKKIFMGDTLAYIRSISNIQTNTNNLMSQIVNIYKNNLYINQLFEFLDMKVYENKIGKKKIERIESIEIKNLSYRYANSNVYALRNINLTIKKNETIALVGQNGSGKTTLIKILAGFYNDYEGEIFINNLNLKDIDKEDMKKKIGILFQDFNKYELNIRENISISNIKYLNEDIKIKEIMNLANLNSNKFSNLDKQLGFWFDNGQQLSGGEWLGIGIARTFIRDASLYILDEPNAALDAITENNIFKNLNIFMKNRISIIITHRVHNVKFYANKIIVFNKGEIEDSGKHEELIKTCSMYKKLYQNSLNLY